MLTIKLNENTNSGMLYAIAYCEDPDIYSEDFWGWDTESDVGYELMEFGSLIQDADVFDSLEAAEDRADDVLSSIFENEVFIVGLDPYTPHNLTGFVKKIIRDSINESKSMDEVIKVGDKVKVSTPGNDYYNGRTGVVDYTEDGIVTVKFDDNNSPRLNNFDLNQVTKINESKSIKESAISRVEPVVKFRGKSSHTFTPDKKWEIDFDEEGNVLARTRQGKPYYFSGHINDKTNEFGHTDEDAIIQAAREQHKLKFGKLTSRKNESKSIKEEYIEATPNDKDCFAFITTINKRTRETKRQRIEGSYGKIRGIIASKQRNETLYDFEGPFKNESKSIKESTTGDYVEVAYICDGLTNFHVYGGGFKTSDALVAVEDEKGKRLRLTMGDVCEFYTWYDAKGNVIHEPAYYSED